MQNKSNEIQGKSISQSSGKESTRDDFVLKLGIFVLQLATLWGLFVEAPYKNLGVKEWIIFCAGGFLAAWAFIEMNLKSRFHFLPATRDGAFLLKRGPYRWLRHPMYAGIGYMGSSVVLARWDWIGLSCWIAYLAVMEVKMRIEEADLRLTFADYQQYQNSTAKWIPGLY